jgi:hypothetical protein
VSLWSWEFSDLKTSSTSYVRICASAWMYSVGAQWRKGRTK